MTGKNNELVKIMSEIAATTQRFEKLLVGVGHLTTEQYNEAIYDPLIKAFKDSKADLEKEEKKAMETLDSMIKNETDDAIKSGLLDLKKRLLD